MTRFDEIFLIKIIRLMQKMGKIFFENLKILFLKNKNFDSTKTLI